MIILKHLNIYILIIYGICYLCVYTNYNQALNSYGLWLFKQEKYVKAEQYLTEVMEYRKSSLGSGQYVFIYKI